jgi:hypothetical protein
MKYIKQRQAIYDYWCNAGVPDLLAASIASDYTDFFLSQKVIDLKLKGKGFYEAVEQLLYWQTSSIVGDRRKFWQQFTFKNRATK